jgi:hypothetical protein
MADGQVVLITGRLILGHGTLEDATAGLATTVRPLLAYPRRALSTA